MGKLKNKHIFKYIVGAYATSPTLFKWDENSETQYFNGLKKLSSIRGLEIPFWGNGLHNFDDRWFLQNIDPSWCNVLTCVPGTMISLQSDPNFGLASKSEKNRINTIKFYDKARYAVKYLNDYLGKNSIIAVHITSAPSNVNKNAIASPDKFIDSLLEIISWDWCGARIVIEHCDAFSEHEIPQKGFLSINDEIDVIKEVNRRTGLNVGITINWGRSVIEKRNVIGAVEHIKETSNANILSGLMFSGVTDKKDSKYGQWADTHMPPASAYGIEHYENDSLMTVENIKASLMACDMDILDYIGIKLLARPDDVSIERRIGLNRDAMILLDKVISEITLSANFND